MGNVNRRDPNPNNYDISKVIASRVDIAESKKQLRAAKAESKEQRKKKKKQEVKDRIFTILERRETNKAEAF